MSVGVFVVVVLVVLKVFVKVGGGEAWGDEGLELFNEKTNLKKASLAQLFSIYLSAKKEAQNLVCFELF